MAGVSDAFGRHGVIEQLVIWGMLQQLLGAAQGPFLTALAQDLNHAHPELALSAADAADLLSRFMFTEGEAVNEAARTGVNADRFARLADRARVRIPPADLAEAVLRTYMSLAEAEGQARPQGFTPDMLAVLVNLAGDAIGPQDAARALLRQLIPEHGTGAGSVSYDQAIRESRLHDKWGPVLRELAQVLNSPAELAEGVVRNFTGLGEAEAEAARQGVDAARLALLIHLAGDAPGPQQLAEALRRGAIPEAGKGPGAVSFEQGIAEGRLADKWGPVIQALARIWPTPVDALDAQVKGQLDPAEGRRLYQLLGGDEQFHDWLLNTLGESPTPLEAAAMAARGIIAETGTGPGVLSYDQAVHESHYRDKWSRPYREIARHLPPVSTVVTMLAHRQIDTAQAHQLLAANDVDPPLIAAYIGEAEYQAISDYRGLTESAVVSMYVARLIDRPQAASILSALHVSAPAAQLELDYADLRYVIDSINKSVQRISTLFTGRKIGADTARRAFLTLGIPPATVDDLLTDLTIQAQANVKILTETQIVDAWAKAIYDTPEALGELEAIGYTPFDAWTVLSIKAGGPLPGKPPATIAAPAGPVIPGTT